MRSVLWAAVAAFILLGGSAPAFAQMGGGMTYDSKPAYGYKKPAPRPQRFYYRSGDTRTCGEFHYWSGKRCMDARKNPPDLKPGRR
jgi:hypothetical protein